MTDFFIASLPSIIPALVTGLLSYFIAVYTSKKEYQAKSDELELKNKALEQRLTEIETNHKHEMEKLREQYSLQSESYKKQSEQDLAMEIVKDMMSGKNPAELKSLVNQFKNF